MIPHGALIKLADRCRCSVAEIENTIEHMANGEINDPRRSAVSRALDEERIEIIRAWMRTPEGRYAMERDA